MYDMLFEIIIPEIRGEGQGGSYWTPLADTGISDIRQDRVELYLDLSKY